MKKLIKKIYINELSTKDFATKKILDKHPDISPIIVRNDSELISKQIDNDPKRVLYLTHSKGNVVKGCPGTAESYICCRYQVINQTQNCPLNCTYCILQFYLNQPATILFTDFDNILAETRNKLQSQSKRYFRIGTGELADSLALPGSLLFAQKAIKFFASIPNALLELKTKTDLINPLLNIAHNEHTVLSWSMNPEDIIRHEEHLTASLKSRLSAAAEAEKAGYLLGFHFDPILYHPNWENLYKSLVEELYSSIDPARIAWISIGSLRFPPSMKEKITRRYPESKIAYGEMIKGLDGKLRYARPIRVPMYHLLYQELKSTSNYPFIYFCMESPNIWKDVTGFSPINNAHLDYMFAESLFKRFSSLLPEPPDLSVYEKVDV